MLAIGQLHYQSVTAPSHATHAVDSYLLKLRDSDVVFTSQVK